MPLLHFLSLVQIKVAANLKNEISRYYLNYLWWIIEPILSMLTLYIVFGIMLNRGTKDFIPFLLVGLTTWNWFSRSLNNSANSIYSAKNLMVQVNIPKIFFPLVTIFQDTFKHMFATSLILIFLGLYSKVFTMTWICLPVLMVIQFALIAACAIPCAMIVPFVPDLRFLISTSLSLMFYASGIFFDISKFVLPEHQFFVFLNPMAGIIREYRNILLYATWPDWIYLGWTMLFAVTLLVIDLWVLRKLDHIYPRICQQ